MQLHESWQPPEEGVIKVNVDVALPVNMDFLVLSMVARDSSGRCIWWKRKQVFGHPSPTDGEAMDVLFGVQEARERAWSRVRV